MIKLKKYEERLGNSVALSKNWKNRNIDDIVDWLLTIIDDKKDN